MERRSFIKTSCALAIAAGAGTLINTLSGCSPGLIYKTSINDNQIAVPLTRFNGENFQIIRTEKAVYDISLRKDNDTTYSAFLMRCTHADNQLISTGSGFNCPLHGSAFDAKGDVVKGPAEKSLKQYKTSVQGDLIIIYLS